MAELTVGFICQLLNDYFDEPCNWTLQRIDVDGYMLDHNEGWCEEHCGKDGIGGQCWERFFQSIAERVERDG